MFILIQLVLVIDFAHRWAESWVEKYEETSSKSWYCNQSIASKLFILFFLSKVLCSNLLHFDAIYPLHYCHRVVLRLLYDGNI